MKVENILVVFSLGPSSKVKYTIFLVESFVISGGLSIDAEAKIDAVKNSDIANNVIFKIYFLVKLFKMITSKHIDIIVFLS